MGQCAAQNPHEIEASQHLDDRIGVGTSLALKRLALVLKETNTNVYKVPLNHPVVVDLGMIMTQCADEERYKTPLPTGKGKAFGEESVLVRAARYTKYAAAAGQNETEDILKTIEGDDNFGGHVEINHIFTSAKEPKASCPSFFVATDKGTGEVVLSVSGATTMPDAITEAVGEAAPFLDGMAHAGLLAKASQVMQQAQEHIEKALEGSSNAAVSLVGHSIGGGIAILATMQAFGEGSFLEKLAAAGKVKCYAFAPPPTFDGKVSAGCASAIYSFVNGFDCVPRASLGSIGKLLQAVRTVDELEPQTIERVQGLKKDGAPLPAGLPDYEELPEEVQADFKSLYGVGTVLLLSKGQSNQSKRACEKVPADVMDRILMHPDMIQDHLVSAYEEAISDTLMQLKGSKGCC